MTGATLKSPLYTSHSEYYYGSCSTNICGMESYLRAMKKKNAVAQHHGQITQTPAVGGSPNCKLICIHLHNEANFISLGAQRLCIMGDPISPGLGGWAGKLSRPETGPLRTPGESLFLFAYHPFLFGQEPVVLSLLKLGFCLAVGILTPRMGQPGW